MVSIVVVSHSKILAEGVVELAKMMAKDALIFSAGGMEDGSLGTSFDLILDVVSKNYSDDGVAIIMDIGSAVLTTEMVLEAMPDKKIKMLDCPIVEGAIMAALESQLGSSLEKIAQKVQEIREMHKID